jgi:arylsulfatase A-like enzyme
LLEIYLSANLGNDGLLMTDFHSNGTVCSPTRAALLTGKYQHRVAQKGSLQSWQTIKD